MKKNVFTILVLLLAFFLCSCSFGGISPSSSPAANVSVDAPADAAPAPNDSYQAPAQANDVIAPEPSDTAAENTAGSDVMEAEIASLKSQIIVSVTPDTNELGVPRYVVANAACSVLPYVEDNYVGANEFCMYHLLKVDRRFIIETAAGNVETWLLVSAYDGGQISANSFYPAMRMAQIWIKEADTLPYDEETQKLLRYPIFVADGTEDADGNSVRSERVYTIEKTENDKVLLTYPGGTSHWIEKTNIVFPALETYGLTLENYHA